MEVSEELAPEELWDAIKDILTSTAEENISKRRRRQNNVWISAETLELIENKRKLKAQKGIVSKEYKEINRKVQQSCRHDKETQLQEICTNLENEATKGNSKKVFEVIRVINSTFSPKIGAVKMTKKKF